MTCNEMAAELPADDVECFRSRKKGADPEVDALLC